MPTHEETSRFLRDYDRLDGDEAARFMAVLLDEFAPAVDAGHPYPAPLRIKKVQGTKSVFEMTWHKDGRATFEFGVQVHAGLAHIVWRRVGSHDILGDP